MRRVVKKKKKKRGEGSSQESQDYDDDDDVYVHTLHTKEKNFFKVKWNGNRAREPLLKSNTNQNQNLRLFGHVF